MEHRMINNKVPPMVRQLAQKWIKEAVEKNGITNAEVVYAKEAQIYRTSQSKEDFSEKLHTLLKQIKRLGDKEKANAKIVSDKKLKRSSENEAIKEPPKKIIKIALPQGGFMSVVEPSSKKSENLSTQEETSNNTIPGISDISSEGTATGKKEDIKTSYDASRVVTERKDSQLNSDHEFTFDNLPSWLYSIEESFKMHSEELLFLH